jgi:hypothetical protein
MNNVRCPIRFENELASIPLSKATKRLLWNRFTSETTCVIRVGFAVTRNTLQLLATCFFIERE